MTIDLSSDPFLHDDHCRVLAIAIRVGCIHLVVSFIRISVLHFLLSLFEAPNINTDPPLVINQTSATLTCNLTDSSLPIQGSHWLFNGKPVESSGSKSSDSFTSLQ